VNEKHFIPPSLMRRTTLWHFSWLSQISLLNSWTSLTLYPANGQWQQLPLAFCSMAH